MPESIYHLEIFQWIDKDVVDNIIQNCETRQYSLWEIIIIEGSESNQEGYIIKSGRVNISIWGKKIAELWAGAIVWEIALLNEEERTATVSAINDVEMIVLSFEHLIDMINNDANKINKEIMRRIEENINR